MITGGCTVEGRRRMKGEKTERRRAKKRREDVKFGNDGRAEQMVAE